MNNKRNLIFLILIIYSLGISAQRHSEYYYSKGSVGPNDYKYSLWKYDFNIYSHFNHPRKVREWKDKAKNNPRKILKKKEVYSGDSMLVFQYYYDTNGYYKKVNEYKKGKLKYTFNYDSEKMSCYSKVIYEKLDKNGISIKRIEKLTDTCKWQYEKMYYKKGKLKHTEKRAFFYNKNKDWDSKRKKDTDIKIYKPGNEKPYKHWVIEYNEDKKRKRTVLYGKNGKLLKIWDHSCDLKGKEVDEKTDTVKICFSTEHGNDGSYSEITEEIYNKGRITKSISKWLYGKDSSLTFSYNQYFHWGAVTGYIHNYDSNGTLYQEKRGQEDSPWLIKVKALSEADSSYQIKSLKKGIEKIIVKRDTINNIQYYYEYKNDVLVKRIEIQDFKEDNLRLQKQYDKKGILKDRLMFYFYYY